MVAPNTRPILYLSFRSHASRDARSLRAVRGRTPTWGRRLYLRLRMHLLCVLRGDADSHLPQLSRSAGSTTAPALGERSCLTSATGGRHRRPLTTKASTRSAMIPLRQVGILTIAASGLVLAGPHRGLQPTVHRDAGCQVRGVWELVSVSRNGKDQPLAGYRGMKVLTDRHFMFVGQAAKRDTLPLKTETDTLRAYQMSGGAGTYSHRR